MIYILLQLLFLGALAGSEYVGLSYKDRVALTNLLTKGYDYIPVPMGPLPRDLENTASNSKVVVPPNTFIAGGAGEGVQHLGAEGDIPNRQNPIPEVASEYDNPPNPCPSTMDLSSKVRAYSKVHRQQLCACDKGWEADRMDCSQAPRCCLPYMPNQAEFVNRYQLSERAVNGHDIYSPSRNKYSTGTKRSDHSAKKTPQVYKRSANPFLQGDMVRHIAKKSPALPMAYVNPYLYNQPRLQSVVAKKAPSYSGAKPVM